MSARRFECLECGAVEHGMDNDLEPMHPDVKAAATSQQIAFEAAHAGCRERNARAAKRLDALEDKGRRRIVALRGG